jgi:hypothetical protein
MAASWRKSLSRSAARADPLMTAALDFLGPADRLLGRKWRLGRPTLSGETELVLHQQGGPKREFAVPSPSTSLADLPIIERDDDEHQATQAVHRSH